MKFFRKNQIKILFCQAWPRGPVLIFSASVIKMIDNTSLVDYYSSADLRMVSESRYFCVKKKRRGRAFGDSLGS